MAILYGPKEASEFLDMPASTLRRLSADYSRFLSEHANRSGRKRQYTDEDLRRLKIIRRALRERRPPEEVERLVTTEVLEPEPEKPASALAIIPEIMAGFERISEQLAAMQSDRQSDRETMFKLEQELERLREQLEESRRPIWDKLRRRFNRGAGDEQSRT